MGCCFIPIEAIKLLFSNKKIFKYSIYPIIIGLVLYAVSVGSLFYFTPKIITKFMGISIESNADGFFSSLWMYLALYLSSFIISASLSFLLTLVFNFVMLIIASPFNEKIAREVLKEKGFKVPREVPFWKDIVRILIVESKKALFFGLIIFGAWIVSLIPLLGFIYFIVSLSILGYAYSDYALEVLRKTYKERVDFYFGNWIVLSLFGLLFYILTIIPFINVILYPFLTINGALLTCYILKKEQENESKITTDSNNKESIQMKKEK